MSTPGDVDNRREGEGRPRFARERVAADASSAARLRAELDGWLRAHVVTDGDGALVNDVLLAVYEGLANAAEYAYLESPTPGTLDVHAHLDSDADALTVTVTDHGRWQIPRFDPSDPAHRLRGRGIPLMKALATDASIRTTTAGTQVRLTWIGLAQS